MDEFTDGHGGEGVSREKQQSKQVLLIGSIVGGVLLIMAFSFYGSSRGEATASDGIEAVARIESAPEGSCWVGVAHNHCYQLSFTVYPRNAQPFKAKVDVNVEDRFASRIQPGSFVYVIQDKKDPSKVYLNAKAFADPAPKAPASSPPGVSN